MNNGAKSQETKQVYGKTLEDSGCISQVLIELVMIVTTQVSESSENTNLVPSFR